MASKKIRIKKKHVNAMKKNRERFRFKLINKLRKRSIPGNKCINPFPRTRHRNLRKSRIKIISSFKYKFDKIIKNTTYGFQYKYYNLINDNMVLPSAFILSKII